jgi:hypothetical protein
MSELTQDHLKEIAEKLESMEQKIGSKWTVPILVAVISGLIGMANVVIQANLERSRVLAELDRAEASKIADEERAEGEKFYLQMYDLTSDVRKRFKNKCNQVERNEDQLNALLEKYRDLAEANRVKYGDEFTNSLHAYSDWVAESLFDPQTSCRQLDNSRHEQVSKALKEFYDTRCKRQRREEPAVGFLGLRL